MIRPVGWFKHAFAIDQPGPAVPTPAQEVVVDRLCAEVVRRGLTGPALLMLEMHRPLNYAAAQVLNFFQPLVGIVADTGGYVEFARFLEQRGSIDYLCVRLEAAEAHTAVKQRPDVLERASGGPGSGDASAAERHAKR
jgi:hypothetical protein